MNSSRVYTASSRYGLGVFVKEAIPEGEVILQLEGQEVDPDLPQYGGKEEPKLLQTGLDSYIFLELPGVLVNHSCEPNCGVARSGALFALRKIEKDEEIFYDYSTTMDVEPWTLNCHCQAKRCRGLIGDFSKLPLPIQQRYLQLGAVTDFVFRQMEKSLKATQQLPLNGAWRK